jgi:hypothetical protein
MKRCFAVLLASLAAALVPAMAIACVFFFMERGSPNPVWPVVFVVAAIVAFAHAVLLGVVAAGWLLRVGWFRLLPMVSAGLVIGSVPAAIWQHPFKAAGTQSNAWSGGVQTLDNGVLTAAGWMDYAQFVGSAGLLGVLGAAAFYLVYKGISPDNSFKRSPLRGSA